jgi:hypothetical protein
MSKPRNNRAYKEMEPIAKCVRENARKGLNMTQIFAICVDKGYDQIPRSSTTFNKLYRKHFEGAKADLDSQIANKVIENALNGSDDSPTVQKDRHFYLERKAGWNKTEVQEHREVEDDETEKLSALDSLISALGIKDPEED